MKAWYRMVLCGLMIALIPTVGAASVLIFDMGTPDSAVYPGARQVSVSDGGWGDGGERTAHNAPGDSTTLIYTNPLTQDCIYGATPTTYRFKAAPGEWFVYVTSGTGAVWPRGIAQYWDFGVTVDGESWRCQFASPEWAGPYLQPHHIFTTTSRGMISLSFTPQSKWVVSGIVAWQAQDEVAAQRIISSLEQWAPDDVLLKWREDPRQPTGPKPALTKADERRGFYLWHRHWATPIYPKTNPTPAEMNPVLKIFASPGEYEPLTFTVRPLRNLSDAEILVENIGPVAASNIDIRKVTYLRARPNYVTNYRWRTVPDVLERWKHGALPQGENATFWLTICVPEQAAPGLYQGRVRFRADGATVDLPVQLRIVAAKLLDDPDHTYGIYYDDPLRRVNDSPDDISRAFWVKKSNLEHADMVAHGTRNVTLSLWAGGKNEAGEFQGLKGSCDRLEPELQMAVKYGFQPPYVMHISSDTIYEKYMKEGLKSHLKGVKMPPEAFFSELTDFVKAIEAERLRRGWPEFIYQPYDEPASDPAIIEFGAKLYQAVKAAGVRTYITAAPEKPGYQPLKPYIDVWCTQTFLPSYEEAVADTKARGVEYWCYPNGVAGENDHTPVPGARMTYGFGFWRSGFRRLIPWIYQYQIGDPMNYLDDGSMDFMMRSEADGTPIPVALWEAYREGYDDLRYLYSLKQAIAQADASSSLDLQREAADAQRVLDEVWQAIPVSPKYQYESFWSPEEMDAYRWLVAEKLERLTKLQRNSK